MSITDELRTGGIYRFTSNRRVFTEEELTAIADRIDAAHEEAIASVMNDALYHANDKDMADLGWVRKEEGKTISTCYVDVVPRFDWKLMALELEQFAEIVRGMAGDDE